MWRSLRHLPWREKIVLHLPRFPSSVMVGESTITHCNNNPRRFPPIFPPLKKKTWGEKVIARPRRSAAYGFRFWWRPETRVAEVTNVPLAPSRNKACVHNKDGTGWGTSPQTSVQVAHHNCYSFVWSPTPFQKTFEIAPNLFASIKSLHSVYHSPPSSLLCLHKLEMEISGAG